MQKKTRRPRNTNFRLEPRRRPVVHLLGEAPDIDLTERVLYRDPMVLVIDKPAGLPVHAGPSGGPNLEAGLASLMFEAKDRPALAHRLDRDTAGCLALGRGEKGLKRLGRLFREGLVGKVYWAVVEGGPVDDRGEVTAPLLKTNTTAGWRVDIDAAGKPARTRWQVLGRGDGFAWMAFQPATGRTHQVRVHAASLGCPIIGDTQYGATVAAPMHLLARSLTLPLYQERPPVVVEADPPDHMRKRLRALGWR